MKKNMCSDAFKIFFLFTPFAVIKLTVLRKRIRENKRMNYIKVWRCFIV